MNNDQAHTTDEMAEINAAAGREVVTGGLETTTNTDSGGQLAYPQQEPVNQFNSEGLIDKLLPEQEAKIPFYVDKWLKIGLDTSPCNRHEAERALRDAYNYLGKNGNALEFRWVDSPYAGAKMAAQEAKGDMNVTLQEIRDQASNASYGSFEAYWVSLYDFISNELPIKPNPLYDIVSRVTQNTGVYWTFEDLVIISERPVQISLQDNQLHSTDGLAIKYKDGSGVFAYKGERKASFLEVKMAALKDELDAKEKASV